MNTRVFFLFLFFLQSLRDRVCIGGMCFSVSFDFYWERKRSKVRLNVSQWYSILEFILAPFKNGTCVVLLIICCCFCLTFVLKQFHSNHTIQHSVLDKTKIRLNKANYFDTSLGFNLLFTLWHCACTLTPPPCRVALFRFLYTR